MKTNYIIEEDIKGKPLVIRDVGPWDKFMTVTNAAEDVVAELYHGDRISDGRRLYYIDSDGQMDELLHDHGIFKGFAPGPRERRKA
jgi:hypothetical protein